MTSYNHNLRRRQITASLVSDCNDTTVFNGPFPGLFSYFRLFNKIWHKMLSMTEFELQTSGIGSNCSTNWATTTAPTSPLSDFIRWIQKWNSWFCFSSNDHARDVLRRLVARAPAQDQRLGLRVDRDQDGAAGRDQRLTRSPPAHLVWIQSWRTLVAGNEQ